MRTTKTTKLSITIKTTTPERLFLPKFPELRKGPPMLLEWKTNYGPQDLAPSRVPQLRLGKSRLAATTTTTTNKTDDMASIVRPLPLPPGRALPGYQDSQSSLALIMQHCWGGEYGGCRARRLPEIPYP